MSHERPLCFVHIPKTSGAGIRAYLSSKFALDETLITDSPGDFRSLSRDRLSEFRLICTHLGPAAADALPMPPSTVTFLREPLARSYSWFRNVQRRGEPDGPEYSRRAFEEAVDLMPANVMARSLAADELLPLPFWLADGRMGDDELFDRALARLEGCDVIGLVERHHESLQLLADRFGWAPPAPMPMINACRHNGAGLCLSPEGRRGFEERNAVDLELYARAIELFRRRLRISRPATARTRYEARVIERSRPLVGRHSADLGVPINGDGWTAAAVTEFGTVRMIGPSGQAHLDLAMGLPPMCTLDVHIGLAVVDSSIDSLRVTVNGEPVVLHRAYEGARVLTGDVHTPRPAPLITRILFEQSQSAANPWAGESERQVGVGIESVTFSTVGKATGTTHRPPSVDMLYRPSPPWVLQPSIIERFDELDLWDRFDELRTDGYTTIPDFIDPDTVDRIRSIVCSEAQRSVRPIEHASTWSLLHRDPVFVSIMMDPRQLALADASVGFGQLGYQAGILRDADCYPLSLHAEQSGWLPSPYSMHQHLLVTLLSLDDLDDDNGCTTFVPGSHFSRMDPPQGDEETARSAVRLRAPRGSLTCWLGGTWHGTHPRSAPGRRAGLHHIFMRPGLRPIQDYQHLPPAVVADPEVRLRLGLQDHLVRDESRRFESGDLRVAAGMRGFASEGSISLPWRPDDVDLDAMFAAELGGNTSSSGSER